MIQVAATAGGHRGPRGDLGGTLGGPRGGLGNSCTQSDITISLVQEPRKSYTIRCDDQCLTSRSLHLKRNNLRRSMSVEIFMAGL